MERWQQESQKTVYKAINIIQSLLSMRRLIVWFVQIGIFAISAVTAFLLRFDFILPQSQLKFLLYGLAIWIIAKVIVFYLFKLDRGIWRYVSLKDLVRVGAGNLVSSLVACSLILLLAPAGFPRSVFVLDLLICFLGTIGLRVAVRMVLEAGKHTRNLISSEKCTLIYGAGGAGASLLREIQHNSKLPYHVAGFIDDRADLQGLRIAGLRVLGKGNNLDSIVNQLKVEMILIAIPSATGEELTRILEHCNASGVEYKSIPGLGDVIEGKAIVGQMREVAVEDLLGRSPVRLEEEQIRVSIEGKMVMVTGAAGSIGSELCRQIARFRPAGIVGFEIAESPLFEIDREMQALFPNVAFHPEIGSIQNRARLDDVLQKYRPKVVYHAAAYKHVPLMEVHVFEAIENNVFGTYNVAVAAADNGVEDFVMISSDKAVRPTNVMGASKRVSELVLLALQNGRTKYVAVRFGNVLGSNGSVVPIFKKQISAGGPVTVTHPEMRRFFMTIPEACQLVLQASAIGKGGQICVLDMGQPVKIVDLARNLILLSGLRPDKDIKIEFSGMRPGEKLYEEINSLLEDTVPTEHEKVRIFVGAGMLEKDAENWLDSLHEICLTRDTGRLVVALKEIVLDYSPSTHLLKRIIEHQDQPAVAAVGTAQDRLTLAQAGTAS